MGIRGEIFSNKVILPNRTYFFNVKENRTGDLYLNIVESKNRDSGGFERQSVILFADDLQEFLKGFDESLKVLEKASRDKRYSNVKREDTHSDRASRESRDECGGRAGRENRDDRGGRTSRENRDERGGRARRDNGEAYSDRAGRGGRDNAESGRKRRNERDGAAFAEKRRYSTPYNDVKRAGGNRRGDSSGRPERGRGGSPNEKDNRRRGFDQSREGFQSDHSQSKQRRPDKNKRVVVRKKDT